MAEPVAYQCLVIFEGKGERMVEQWFRSDNGEMAAERITTGEMARSAYLKHLQDVEWAKEQRALSGG